jgi:hypothetical protein
MLKWTWSVELQDWSSGTIPTEIKPIVNPPILRGEELPLPHHLPPTPRFVQGLRDDE